MIARHANKEEIANWDTLVVSNSPVTTVFSTQEYAEIKKQTGYTPLYVVVDTLPVLILQKKAWPFGTLWYLPKGPNVINSTTLIEVVNAIKVLAKKHGVFFVRLESELPLADTPLLEKQGLVASAPVIPSQSTILVDISKSEDAILTSLPQKGRYAIRRAKRDGVTIKQVAATEPNCKIMYKLLSTTAEGQFGIRSYEYYKTYWQTFEKAAMGALFFAYYNDVVVAGAYALVFNHKSTYKDGASIRERSAYGASHLLQWEVIRWAKSQGSTLHDLCGSPPSARIHDATHPHHNIGLFKTSFNKEVTDYIGCYDVRIKPLAYALWTRIGERVHKKLYYKKTHDYYY